MSNGFTDDLIKYVYHHYTHKQYGVGKSVNLSQEELIKLRLRFKLIQNKLYKIILTDP